MVRKKKKKHSEKATCSNKHKERNACISKNDWTKGRGFNESINTKNEAKQNKTNVTPEKDVMTSENRTPGGCKFAPLVASRQGRAN